jgi:group I intron endonuclease
MFNVTLEYLSTLSALTMQSGIYSITSPSNKVYIGSAVNIEKRWKEHLRDLRRGDHHNPPLQRAYLKYAPEDFTFAVLEYCDKSILLEREQFYMDVVVSAGKYNVLPTAGSPRGRRHSAASRAKMSASQRRRNATCSEETRAKMSEASSVSGVIGVAFRKHVRKWAARAPGVGGKKKHLGYFETKEDAASARDAYVTCPETYQMPAHKLRASGPSRGSGIAYDISKGKWKARAPLRSGVRKHIGSFATKEEAVAARAAYMEQLENCKNG